MAFAFWALCFDIFRPLACFNVCLCAPCVLLYDDADVAVGPRGMMVRSGTIHLAYSPW